MDTSEQYIKMRLAAIPDLGMGRPPHPNSGWVTKTAWMDRKGDWYYSDEFTHCQLERQDQLQAMVGVSLSYPYILMSKFISWYNGDYHDWLISDDGIDMESMEQLWLAFVMKENHNKDWRDGEWMRSE